jgi:hypothetical protein
MTNKKICRSFRQDFPQFVERAEALGVNIRLYEGRRKGRERVFYLNGYKQLTGYATRSDGLPFTLEDAARNIDNVLTSIEEDRAATADMPIAARFARVMAEMRQIVPERFRGEAHKPNGDLGFCLFMEKYTGLVKLKDIGIVAEAKTEWRYGETDEDHMSRLCDMLEDDFSRRQAEVAA